MPIDSKKLLRTLTVGRGAILVPHIEAYQQRGKFPEEWNITIKNRKESDGHFHPSSHAFTPPLQLWLEMKGRVIYPSISPALRRTFDCGHMWHGYLQAMLIDMGFVKPENVERHITHKIQTPKGEVIGSGTGDLIDVVIPGFDTWLVDIKTMNKVEFEQGASEFTMTKWRAQVSCYMDWFGTDHAMILAVCKDSPHQMREYQIQKDEALLNEIYDRWAYVAACLRTDTTPDEDYKVDPLLLNPGDSVLDVEMAKTLKADPGYPDRREDITESKDIS